MIKFTSAYKCGRCSIKDKLSKSERVSMFAIVRDQLDEMRLVNKKMVCHSCDGTFFYNRSGMLSTYGGSWEQPEYKDLTVPDKQKALDDAWLLMGNKPVQEVERFEQTSLFGVGSELL